MSERYHELTEKIYKSIKDSASPFRQVVDSEIRDWLEKAIHRYLNTPMLKGKSSEDDMRDAFALTPPPKEVKTAQEQAAEARSRNRTAEVAIENMNQLSEVKTGERVWCEHIVWDKRGEPPCWRIGRQKSFVIDNVSDDWDICPVAGCHATRPKQEPTLEERILAKVEQLDAKDLEWRYRRQRFAKELAAIVEGNK